MTKKPKKLDGEVKKTRKIRIYKTYNYKIDPVIDQVLELLENSSMKFTQASDVSGVASSTIRNWSKGKTRRPQSTTIEAVGRAAGYGRKWVKIKEE